VHLPPFKHRISHPTELNENRKLETPNGVLENGMRATVIAFDEATKGTQARAAAVGNKG
jgi:hypothetical protein